MFKKSVLLFVIVLSPIWWGQSLSAQNRESDVFVPIAKYLESGSAAHLSAWFSDNIELLILGERHNCSRNQAKQILKRFFDDYTPSSFNIIHKGGTYPMSYAIGNLQGGGNMFKITVFVKTNDKGNYIQQITIEKE